MPDLSEYSGGGRRRGPARRVRAVVTAGALLASTLLGGALLAAAPPAAGAAPSASTVPSASTASSAGPAARGAALPGLREELATGPLARTDGSVIGPDYTEGTLASEAVGRRAVQLTAAGQYVQFRLAAPANAVDIDYALPAGTTGSLSVYVDGVRLPRPVSLTAQYSYISTPEITGSLTHHFFNDARLFLGRQLRAGDTVRLQADGGASALPVTINLADFYQVAPARPRPPRSVSVLAYGADPTGTADSAAAFRSAIAAAAAAHETVWVPAGRFLIGTPLQVASATIEGAGSWYTELLTNELIDNAAAVPGPVNLSGFAILGSTVGRHDDSSANAINGSLGTGSVVSGLWIQNTNVGLWLEYGNTRVTVAGNVIVDTDADGINLNGNATDCTVTGNLIRNTGDDGLAIWSYPAADTGDVFTGNTVEQPNLANGIADYGGTDNTISRNVVVDTNALGSGITVSNEQFASPGFTPLAGTITVSGNTVIRAGAMNPNWGHPMSAVQIDAYDYPIAGVAIKVTGDTILDSPYSAFELVSGDGTGLPVTGLTISDVRVDGTGTVVFQAETAGSAYVAGVRATHVGVAGTVQDQYPPATPAFTFSTGPGNSGWSLSPTLAYFPAPVPPVP
jgi:Pectate lyase superfamily protein